MASSGSRTRRPVPGRTGSRGGDGGAAHVLIITTVARVTIRDAPTGSLRRPGECRAITAGPMDSTPARRWPASRPAWPAAPTSGWRRACAPASPAGSASTRWWCGWPPSCWPWPTGERGRPGGVRAAGRGRRHRGGARRRPARRDGGRASWPSARVRHARRCCWRGGRRRSSPTGEAGGHRRARHRRRWPGGDGDHRWRDLAAWLPGNRWRSCGGGGVAGPHRRDRTVVHSLGTFLATNGPSRPECHRHVGVLYATRKGHHPDVPGVRSTRRGVASER